MRKFLIAFIIILAEAVLIYAQNATPVKVDRRQFKLIFKLQEDIMKKSYKIIILLAVFTLALTCVLAVNAQEINDNIKQSLGAKTAIVPIPVWVIGSYDKEGKPNIMTAAWVGICCSRPPCVTISLRKATYTYGNVMERKAYTVNIPSESLANVAAHIGRVSGKKVNKFETTGLTPVRSDLVDAPYVKEFPLIIECKVIHIYEVGMHTMFIGEIKDVKADKTVLGKNETPDMDKVKPFVFAPGSSAFFNIGKFLGNVSALAKEIKK